MKIIYDKDLTDKQKKKHDKWIKADEEKWEKGDYGRNPKYMKRASMEDERKITEMINAGREKQKLYSLRLSSDLVNDLKVIATKKHMGYQTLLKMIAVDYVEEWKNKHSR